jgi:multimeric flavodoxin WrbA
MVGYKGADMKILALNSSPRKSGESKTEIMMNSLVDGMRDAGAEVETVNLREKTINDCVGCFSCWNKTPGECIQKDDMSAELFPKYISVDMIVMATPLYHSTVNATMKRFIERTLPITKMEIRNYDGRSYHPLRFQIPDTVALSVAGFSEDNVFEQLTSYMRFLYKKALVAEIYRPAAEAMVSYEDQLAAILAATRDAGKELVTSRTVSPDTMARILKPLETDQNSQTKSD